MKRLAAEKLRAFFVPSFKEEGHGLAYISKIFKSKQILHKLQAVYKNVSPSGLQRKIITSAEIPNISFRLKDGYICT